MNQSKSLILKELKQRKPFRSLSQEAVVGLLRTADILRRGYYAVVEERGLTPQWYNVLRILRGSGPEGLPTIEIANRLLEKSPGITRFVDKLERRGLLERRRNTSDRRQVFCVITQAGLEQVNRMDAPVEAWDHGSLAMLSAKELRTLIVTLDRIRLHYTNGIASSSEFSAVPGRRRVRRKKRKG